MTMKKALIRLEDVGPGGFYATRLSMIKLAAIADYLDSEKVPFQISIIPRYVNPAIKYDKSIEDTSDFFIKIFNDTIKDMAQCYEASVGMHGYTHQFFRSESAKGYEFYYPSCTQNCPPNDSANSCTEYDAFINSYASHRMAQGYNAFKKSGITLNWGFSTPHYTSYDPQRCIINAWAGLLYQPDPSAPSSRRMSIKDTDTPFYRGVVYVPTPLGYVAAEDPDGSIERICSEIQSYTEQDLASFYYHPHLEFSFIHVTDSGIVYDDDSYLKRLIRCFKAQNFTFVPLLSLVDFVPSSRNTNFFPGSENIFFVGNIDEKSCFIIWQPATGTWYYQKSELENFPQRQQTKDLFSTNMALSNWAVGTGWTPLIGDFNGDGKDDVVAWYPERGDWQVALFDGLQLKPSATSWLYSWAVGNEWVPFVGDFNGDGMDDIAIWYPNTGEWQVALSNGIRFIPNNVWLKPWAVGANWVPLIGDFNGDGIDDIVAWNPQNGEWQVALSNGSKFIPDIGNGDYSWLKPWAVGTNWTPLVGDFDGNGISDILVVDVAQGNWQVALSTGSKFVPDGHTLRPWCADPEMEPFVGDFSGDGKSAIVARNPTLRNGTVDMAVSVINDTIYPRKY